MRIMKHSKTYGKPVKSPINRNEYGHHSTYGTNFKATGQRLPVCHHVFLPKTL